jgi:hypothetical protein
VGKLERNDVKESGAESIGLAGGRRTVSPGLQLDAIRARGAKALEARSTAEVLPAAEQSKSQGKHSGWSSKPRQDEELRGKDAGKIGIAAVQADSEADSNPEASKSERLEWIADSGTTEMGDENGANKDATELIDMETDSIEESMGGPDAEWEAHIRSLAVRTAKVPDGATQRARMKKILQTLESEPPEPNQEGGEDAKAWVKNISDRVLDYNQFVAGSFADHLPAWEKLLGDSKRKSAKTVLSWLRKGFKPKFVGTKNEKPQKRTIVESMLRRVVPRERVGELLEGKLPHKVEFANHRSFFTNWEFSKDEIEKLVIWGAASIWKNPDEDPEVMSPLGVADSAGKQRLIINEKYVNLFLEDLPFQYERLRDILAFTERGSYMATWDLKSGYFHVPIHPRFRKYFAFRVGGITFVFNVLCFGFAQTC